MKQKLKLTKLAVYALSHISKWSASLVSFLFIFFFFSLTITEDKVIPAKLLKGILSYESCDNKSNHFLILKFLCLLFSTIMLIRVADNNYVIQLSIAYLYIHVSQIAHQWVNHDLYAIHTMMTLHFHLQHSHWKKSYFVLVN